MRKAAAVSVDEQEVRAKYARLTRLLIERALTITTMESATAGQIASLITDTEGSSAVLRGAFVTYCNEAKVACGVPASVIEEHGVYSNETASAMALACRKAYRADIGIGVTGTMGNVDPANGDSIPGQVHFALALGEAGSEPDVAAFCFDIEPQATRLAYKLAVAELVADELFARLG